MIHDREGTLLCHINIWLCAVTETDNLAIFSIKLSGGRDMLLRCRGRDDRLPTAKEGFNFVVTRSSAMTGLRRMRARQLLGNLAGLLRRGQR